jgi:hypothetical protein
LGRNEAAGQNRKRWVGRKSDRLCLADVPLRGLEALVTGTLLNLEGVGAGESFPRDAGGAQVIEGDVFRRRRVLVQVGAGDPGSPKVLPKIRGEVFEGREAVASILIGMIVLHDKALSVRLLVEVVDERAQRAVYRNSPSHTGLRLLNCARF